MKLTPSSLFGKKLSTQRSFKKCSRRRKAGGLDRRIPDKPELTAEVAAWVQRRNKHHAKADWQFTTADARVKLARLYPHFA